MVTGNQKVHFLVFDEYPTYYEQDGYSTCHDYLQVVETISEIRP